MLLTDAGGALAAPVTPIESRSRYKQRRNESYLYVQCHCLV